MFYSAHRLTERIHQKFFNLLVSREFRSFGKGTALSLPITLWDQHQISLGDQVYIGSHSWLQAIDDEKKPLPNPILSIGSRTSITGSCFISAKKEVVVEEAVLIGRFVHISDHSHAFADSSKPIKEQGITEPKPVRICSGAWLGQGVVVCPGVTIGRNAVIGANSLVNQNIPDFCLAAGSPARVLKKI